MPNEQTVRCPICGEPYVFYAYSAADQSACPKCITKARENMGGKYTSKLQKIHED